MLTVADGRFELEPCVSGAGVVLDEPGWTAVLFDTSQGGEHAERIVVAAPLVSYRGRDP